MGNDVLLPTRLSTTRRLAGDWVRRAEFAIYQVAFDLSGPIRLASASLDNYTPLRLAGGQMVQFNLPSEARGEIYTSVTPWPHLPEIMSMESKTAREFRYFVYTLRTLWPAGLIVSHSCPCILITANTPSKIAHDKNTEYRKHLREQMQRKGMNCNIQRKLTSFYRFHFMHHAL